MDLPPVRSNTLPGFCPDIPTEFKSLEEARNSLEYQWNICLQKAVDFEHINVLKEGTESEVHRAEYDQHRLHFKHQYKRWAAAFQAYLDANVANLDSKGLQGAMVLKLSAHVAGMHLDVGAFELLHCQSCWDSLQPVYEELVDTAAVIIDSHKTAKTPSIVKPIFQIDHSLVGPLFAVVHRCRDPHLRRRAISLLYKVPRQEGIWNSILTARVAERLMNIEEAGLGEVKCAADIPDWRRISDVEVTFDLQEKRGLIKYSRLRSYHDTVREPVTDVLEW